MVAGTLTVLQVVPAMHEGGTERGTLEIARALVRVGHHAIVISAGGRLVQALEDAGAEHLQWPIGRKSPATLRLIARLRDLLQRRAVDVVHARSRLPAWVSYLALRAISPDRRPRFVTTVHGLYSVNPYSAIMTKGERVIAVSQTVRSYIETHYRRVRIENVSVIHRGVDPLEFPYGFRPSAAWRQRWKADYPELQGKFLLLLAGRLSRLKGHDDFLSILSRLRDAGLAVHGIVTGDSASHPSYVADLTARISAQSLPVAFIGHRHDMREVYAACDVVLSLSAQPESFGRTVLEPLSLGVPAIGYDHGGVGEILRAIFPLGAIPYRDILGAVDRIVDFARARPRVPAEHPFSLELMQRRTLALYRELRS